MSRPFRIQIIFSPSKPQRFQTSLRRTLLLSLSVPKFLRIQAKMWPATTKWGLYFKSPFWVNKLALKVNVSLKCMVELISVKPQDCRRDVSHPGQVTETGTDTGHEQWQRTSLTPVYTRQDLLILNPKKNVPTFKDTNQFLPFERFQTSVTRQSFFPPPPPLPFH